MITGLSRLRKEKDAYHDMKAFRFKYTGEHGEPPSKALNWKMSLRLPDRMHHDVNRVDEVEPFDWTANGVSRRFATHANVSRTGLS